MKAEKRQIPQPPPPPHEVILTLSEAEARVLRWLSGWSVSVPDFLEEMGVYNSIVTSRADLARLMKDLRAVLDTVVP